MSICRNHDRLVSLIEEMEQDEPKWAAHYRSEETDQSAVRLEYVKAFQQTTTVLAAAA